MYVKLTCWVSPCSWQAERLQQVDPCSECWGCSAVGEKKRGKTEWSQRDKGTLKVAVEKGRMEKRPSQEAGGWRVKVGS